MGAFDASKFIAGLGEAKRRKLEASRRAYDIFGEQVLGDAQELCPVETGALQASGTTLPAEIVGGGKIKKTLGFNTNYAAARHERPPERDEGRTQNPKGQWKFLYTTLLRARPRLAGFVASFIKD